ncbi:MAG: hypothetical protein IKW45_06645 [Clostridia bacterium]|nr:hypothetical protein [Clostridia bacterium]
MDDYIYTDLEEMFCGAVEANGVEWVINRAHFGDYHGGRIGYYQFDGYGNINEDYPSYLIDEDICAEELAKELPQLDEEALEVLKRMAIELVNNGY